MQSPLRWVKRARSGSNLAGNNMRGERNSASGGMPIHGLYTYTSEQNAFHHDPEQKYHPKFTDAERAWLRRWTRSALR